jgi:hypothetical protein
MWIAPERRGGAGQWIVPVLTIAVGVGLAVTVGRRGHLTTGLIALAVLTGYALHLAARRGEGVLAISDGQRGRGNLRAVAMTGDVLIAAIVCGVIVQVLRGASLGPLGWLAAVAGVTYTISALIAGEAT